MEASLSVDKGNVLVTGASRGLGLAIAKRLAFEGYTVIAVARSLGEPLLAAAEASAAGGRGRIVGHPFDLTQIDALADLVRTLKAEHGALYGLVNNAGTSLDGVLATMPTAKIEALVRLNVLSPMILTKAATRSMLAAGRGRVVNIASITAGAGSSGLAAYAATKAAMIGFTKSLARELGRAGVTVNALAPGFIDTELTASLADEDRARIIRRSALGRLAEPDDVGAAAAFLLSDGARNITGAVLTVDAGQTA